jgi:hypothetical protein
MTGNVLRQSMRLVTADHLQEVGEANGFAMSLKPFDVAKDLVQQMGEHAKTMDMCRTLSDRRPRSQRRKSKRGRVNATVHVCTVAFDAVLIVSISEIDPEPGAWSHNILEGNILSQNQWCDASG